MTGVPPLLSWALIGGYEECGKRLGRTLWRTGQLRMHEVESQHQAMQLHNVHDLVEVARGLVEIATVWLMARIL